MKRKRLKGAFSLTLLPLLLIPFLTAEAAALESAKIPDRVKTAAKKMVDQGMVTGLSMVYLEKGKAPVYLNLGHTTKKGFAITERSRFEIGSITKVFTGLETAYLIEKNKLSLKDTVGSLLPDSVSQKFAENVQKISLKDLTTHTSGLPRMPQNFKPADVNNPYVDYTAEQLLAFLGTTDLATSGKHAYSNAGVGLLGYLLTQHEKAEDPGALLQRDLLIPLGMGSTSYTDLESLKITALPHSYGTAVSPWDFSYSTAGAGGLRSSTEDMLKFLQAQMSPEEQKLPTALRQAIQRSQQVLYKNENLKMGYGWFQIDFKDQPLYFHGGATGGFRSFMGFDAKKERGVVILSNDVQSVEPLGLALLNDRFELPEIKVERLSPEVLKAYEGRYQLAPGMVFEVRQENGYLMVKLGEQPTLRVVPAGKHRFAYKEVQASLEFQFDETGQITGLILHQNGHHKAPYIGPVS